MVMPSSLRASAAITSNCGSVIENLVRNRSRNWASIARDERNNLSQSRNRCLLIGRGALRTRDLLTTFIAYLR